MQVFAGEVVWIQGEKRTGYEADEDSNPVRIIERGVHVKLVVSQGKGRLARTEMKDFVVTSVSTKTYNR